MVIDHQVDVRQQAGEVMRLHVHERDLVELLELLRRQRLDLEVEQLHHAQVFGPGHRLEAADHRGLPRAAQDRTQGEAAGHRVRIRVVVRQDQHAIRVVHVALILLHALARHRAAQFGQQRRPRDLGQRQRGDFRKVVA